MSASLPFRWRRPLLALVATALGLLVALLGVFVMGRSFPVRSAALAVGPLRALVDRPLTPDGLGAGGQASDLVLFDPMGITLGPDGAVYLSDRGRGNRGRVIWRIDEDGVVHHVAGSGRMGRAREGEPAADADLTAPEGLAFGPEGRLHFVDNRSNRVLRIEKDGTLSVVAGTGTAGFGGDGGPADRAALDNPAEIWFDSTGNLFISDVYNNRVRRVDPNGIIETVAGTGAAGYGGDGGPAREASLREPWGLFVSPFSDNLLIADGGNHRVREVDSSGRITTIVGSGVRGYAGDGSAAEAARLDSPQSLGFDCAGRLYIGDEHNHVVRVVDEDGVIETLVGTGSPGFSEGGADGRSVQLNDPENVLVRCDGTVLITDGENGRVIEVGAGGAVQTVIGRGPGGERARLRRLFDD